MHDREDDFSRMWRRLTGVTFPNGIALASEKDDKREATKRNSRLKKEDLSDPVIRRYHTGLGRKHVS